MHRIRSPVELPLDLGGIGVGVCGVLVMLGLRALMVLMVLMVLMLMLMVQLGCRTARVPIQRGINVLGVVGVGKGVASARVGSGDAPEGVVVVVVVAVRAQCGVLVGLHVEIRSKGQRLGAAANVDGRVGGGQGGGGLRAGVMEEEEEDDGDGVGGRVGARGEPW